MSQRRTDSTNIDRHSVDQTNIKSKPTTVAQHFLSHPNHYYTDRQLISLELLIHWPVT